MLMQLAAPTAYADPNHVVQFYDNDVGAREAVVDFLCVAG